MPADSKLTVATTGTWNIHPNVFNAVPRGASILIDIRDIDFDTRQQVIDAVLNGAEEVGKKYKCPMKAEVVYAHPPITSADDVCPFCILEGRHHLLGTKNTNRRLG